MAESIIQEDRTHCFICGMNASVEPLDEHHVYFGTANRKKSEKYGLKVYLHHRKCHIFGRESVHGNAGVDRALKARVQQMAMEHYGWSVEDFRKIFGKNYL
jgi:hypothetical protein